MWLKRLLSRDHANFAVLLSVSAQAWMALAGPVTIVAVAHALAPEVQGFYYTFISVLAIQVFFELGLATVLVQLASHEWASLYLSADGRIEGSLQARSRLRGIAGLALRWYAGASVLLAVIFIFGGNCFFANHSEHAVSWRLPWCLLSLATAAYLVATPLISIIEGCNQVVSIYRIRLIQSVLSSLVIIAGLLGGLGLYSLALGASTRLVIVLYWLIGPQRHFVHMLLFGDVSAKVDWFTEIWPFQWRIAISWLSGYFIFSIFTPVMFKYHGPVVAGQMGMTLSLVGAIESVAFSWLSTRAPEFGGLVARRQFTILDRVFLRGLKLALGTAVLGGGVVVIGIGLLDCRYPTYAGRMLPLLPVGLLVLYRVINVAISGLALYLRAHKREPLVSVSVVTALLVGSTTYFAGRYSDALGVAFGLLALTLLWTLPASLAVFFRCRSRWHTL